MAEAWTVGTRVRIIGPHATGLTGRVVEKPEGQWDYPEARDWIIIRLDESNTNQAFRPEELLREMECHIDSEGEKTRAEI
jgi:hypothetical protein